MAQIKTSFEVSLRPNTILADTILDIARASDGLSQLYHGILGDLVLPDFPNAVVEDKTISAWTTDWWRWALQAPAGQGPLDSSDPAATHYNNDGKIFFIAGGLDATITVSADKPILFPMVNIFDTEGPSIIETDPGFQGSYDAEAQRVTNLGQANVTDAFAKITKDGHTLVDIRWPLSSFSPKRAISSRLVPLRTKATSRASWRSTAACRCRQRSAFHPIVGGLADAERP